MSYLEKLKNWLTGKSDYPKQKHVSATPYPQRGVGLSYSGITPNVDLALSLSAVWGCVRKISETIATMPIQMFEVTESGGTRAVRYEHPLYYILHDSPNADMTATEFWQVMHACVELNGNAYAEKQMVGGQLVGLGFLKPSAMHARRLMDGRIEYRYSDSSVQKTWYDDQILHLKGPSLDGIFGLSPVAYMRNTIGIGLSLEQAAGDVFKNGMRPGGIYNIPHNLTKEQRDQAYERIEKFKNDRNGGILVTALGESFSAVQINPEDAQLLASRSWAVEEICRWYGVPPYLVGYTEKSTSWGTGMEQQNLAFLTYALLPRIRREEQAVEKCLLSPTERRRFFIRRNYESLLRADSKTRAEVNAMDVRNGIRSRNEVREKENMDPYDGGDVYTIESNLTTIQNAIGGQKNDEKMVCDAHGDLWKTGDRPD